jgi:uncharacterized protein (TIGR01244 family)
MQPRTVATMSNPADSPKGIKPLSLLLLLLLAVLPGVASCQDRSESGEPPEPTMVVDVRKSEVPGIANFSRIDDTAAFGGATEPSAMATLKKDGFSAVINLRLASEPNADVDASRAAAEAAGLTYVHLPFDADSPNPQFVPSFLAAVGNEANQPAYIHCGSATRAAALWMIKRVLQDGWEMDDARQEGEAIALKPDKAVALATQYISSQNR